MNHAKSYHYGCYACVNLTNTETVEIRIFRETRKYNTFIIVQLLEQASSTGFQPLRDVSKRLVGSFTYTALGGGCQFAGK